MFEKIGLSGVRALPLGAGINKGGHYATSGPNLSRLLFLVFFLFLLFLFFFLPPLLKPQKGLSKFCMGS
jgi:hypothetical protein